jgi:hypothetical protein
MVMPLEIDVLGIVIALWLLLAVLSVAWVIGKIAGFI